MSGFEKRLVLEDHLDSPLSAQLAGCHAFAPRATSTTFGGPRSLTYPGNMESGCFTTRWRRWVVQRRSQADAFG